MNGRNSKFRLRLCRFFPRSIYEGKDLSSDMLKGESSPYAKLHRKLNKRNNGHTLVHLKITELRKPIGVRKEKNIIWSPKNIFFLKIRPKEICKKNMTLLDFVR